jgi:hypothetical protein
MAQKFAAIICAALMLFASSAHAMSKRIYTDDERAHAKAVYTSCKKSTVGATEPEDFTTTICYAHISGTMEGVSATGLMYFSSNIRISCTPNRPTVFEYAQRYVAHVDARNKKYPENEFYPFPAAVFDEIFDCQKTKP